MSLPSLPGWTGEGYEWMGQLKDGWYAVGLWGEDGWNCGQWPYVIICHYDNEGESTFGQAVYVEGDLDIKEFTTRDERDHATSETCVWYWSRDESTNAPKHMKDGRLGPFKGL